MISAEANLFTQRIVALPPGASLDGVLALSIEDEAVLRCFFATDRSHPRLANPYVGLLSVFDAPESLRTTHARIVKDEAHSMRQHVFPLKPEKRCKEGEPATVASLADFQRNWAVFTEGSLSLITDWNNMVAAGGSVLACLLPLADKDAESERTTREYYHSAAYPTSDVDLFLWGMTPQQVRQPS